MLTQTIKNLIIILSWTPGVTFKKATEFELIITAPNKGKGTTRFKASLTSPSSVLTYLRHLYLATTGSRSKNSKYVGKLVKEASGKNTKTYQVPFTNTNEGMLENLAACFLLIQKKHFIVNRKEWVSNEQFHAFFQNTGGIWDIAECNYPPANFIEHTRQTIYEMEQNPGNLFNDWANAPALHLLENWVRSDKKFAVFAKKELRPLITKFRKNKQASAADIKRQLIFMVGAVEKYRENNGIVV